MQSHTPHPELYYHLFSSTPLTLITIHLVETYSGVAPTCQMYKHTVSSREVFQINSPRYYRKLFLREIREMHHPAEISKLHPFIKKIIISPFLMDEGNWIAWKELVLLNIHVVDKMFASFRGIVRGVAVFPMVHGLCPIRTIVLLDHGLLHSPSPILL